MRPKTLTRKGGQGTEMAEIPSEMNVLDSQISRLGEILTDLKTVISPILSKMEKPTAEEKKQEELPLNSDLAMNIRINRKRIEGLIDFVYGIREDVRL